MTRGSTKLASLEFDVFRAFGDRLRGEKILVACSGGRDSVALTHILARLSKRLSFDLAIAHVHHGKSSNPRISRFREKASRFVAQLADDLEVQFFRYEVTSNRELKSEEDLREARLEFLEKARAEKKFSKIAFAHHADDLFETRLIRMIRGTGPEGLRAMSEWTETNIRPLLKISREAVAAYASNQDLKWVEDPTNAETDAFRNWIRNKWLPSLEKRQPRGAINLQRSLESLVEVLPRSADISSSATANLKANSITRDEFAQLGKLERRAWLASRLRQEGARDFSARQIEEIEKRILALTFRGQKRASFEVAGFIWHITASGIETQRPSRRTP